MSLVEAHKKRLHLKLLFVKLQAKPATKGLKMVEAGRSCASELFSLKVPEMPAFYQILAAINQASHILCLPGSSVKRKQHRPMRRAHGHLRLHFPELSDSSSLTE